MGFVQCVVSCTLFRPRRQRQRPGSAGSHTDDRGESTRRLEGHADYIQANYTDVKMTVLNDASEAGITKKWTFGTGKEKDGTAVRLLSEVVSFKSGKLVEIWYVAPNSDTAGLAAAGDVI